LIKEKEQYIVEIKSINHQAQGICNVDGMIVFVDGALPNEVIKIEIIQVKKEYAKGKIIEIIKKNDNRIEPICPYFFECGGCHLMHATYSYQLELKRQIVEDAMKRIGKINTKVLSTIGMTNPLGYRNKVQMPVGGTKKDIKIGFYKPMSHEIVDIKRCIIQHDESNRLSEIVRKMIYELGIEPYDEVKSKGLLRHLLIRKSYTYNEIMLVLIMTKLPPKTLTEQIINYLNNNFQGITSLYININNQKTNVILGEEDIHIYGKKSIKDKIGEFTFDISPKSFFQVNSIMVEKLYEKAVEYIDDCDLVFDAYCGIGTISLMLSKNAKMIHGFENVYEAIEDAKINALINGIDNVQFVLGNAEIEIPKFINKGTIPDAVVLDPPRKGCDKSLIDVLGKSNIKRIVYVSCNPSTLARDLHYLTEYGYNVEFVQPVDMFPETYHVECVVLMQNVKNK